MEKDNKTIDFKTIVIYILIVLIIFKYFNITNVSDEKVLFLGDSLTSRYDLNKYYKNYNVVNSGIGGNLTSDILENLDTRVFKYNPDKVFILVGTNDIEFSSLTNEEIKNNIDQIVIKIKDNNKSTKIYIQSVYPVNKNVNKEIVGKRTNKRIKDLNKRIEKICEDNTKCTYINMYDKLEVNNKLFRPLTVDGLHLNRFGYRYITKKLKKYINE